MFNSRNVSKDHNSFNVEEFITDCGQGLFCFPNSDTRLPFTGHKLTFNNSEMFGCTWGALPSRWLYVSNFPTDVNLWRYMRSIFKELSKIQGNECDWANEGVIMVSWIGAQSIQSTILNRFDEVDMIRFARSLSVGQTLVLLIEYYDTRAARATKESINGIIIERVQIRVQYYDAGSHSWDAVAEDFKYHQKIGLAIFPPPRNRSEDMAKVSPSLLENSTVISSGNRAIPEKNTLDIERIRNGIFNFIVSKG
ncbi:25166_t:CDS:2 [Gigaspora margarita]|uniref:25166_t:CDS:1 n=1 Tax=Gigaspora margarita TaxID=4874 RepID=A0ABM8VWS9_GIGMA|nr:25166_t:CDS:2 [Gigaspora margarita]